MNATPPPSPPPAPAPPTPPAGPDRALVRFAMGLVLVCLAGLFALAAANRLPTQVAGIIGATVAAAMLLLRDTRGGGPGPPAAG